MLCLNTSSMILNSLTCLPSHAHTSAAIHFTFLLNLHGLLAYLMSKVEVFLVSKYLSPFTKSGKGISGITAAKLFLASDTGNHFWQYKYFNNLPG